MKLEWGWEPAWLNCSLRSVLNFCQNCVFCVWQTIRSNNESKLSDNKSKLSGGKQKKANFVFQLRLKVILGNSLEFGFKYDFREPQARKRLNYTIRLWLDFRFRYVFRGR